MFYSIITPLDTTSQPQHLTHALFFSPTHKTGKKGHTKKQFLFPSSLTMHELWFHSPIIGNKGGLSKILSYYYYSKYINTKIIYPPFFDNTSIRVNFDHWNWAVNHPLFTFNVSIRNSGLFFKPKVSKTAASKIQTGWKKF